jgi:branched-chain amino acid transport system permease protein
MLVLVIGGAGYLYGGVIGAVGFKLLQDWLSGITPQYWHFWIGLILVALVMLGRERLMRGARAPILAAARALGLGRKLGDPAAAGSEAKP